MPYELPSAYQTFIAKSRYARWLDDKMRRETWDETINRYLDFFFNTHKPTAKAFREKLSASDVAELREILYKSMGTLEALPSMRCLMTAGVALEKDNIAGYNCFDGNERYLTIDGLKTFAETVGTTQTVLNKNGEWVPGKIKSFGKQKLQRVTFKPTGISTRSKTNVRHSVKVTEDHRWITANRGEVTDLQVGDVVAFVAPKSYAFNLEAWLKGFGFGDGTIDNRGRARIRLCGEKAQHLDKFAEYGHSSIMYPPSSNGDPVIVFHKGFMIDWKEVPSEDADAEYVANWIDGYYAADGCDRQQQPVLAAQDSEALDFVESNAVFSKRHVTGRNTCSVTTTNFGERKNPLERMTFRDAGYFKVTDIEKLDVKSQVYCAVVKDTQTFVLEHGILTGNCAFLAVDDPRAFAETCYILMNGTGVGFSVERQFVNKLPDIAEEFHATNTVIVVEDSKLGWAKALNELITLLYQGQIPKWDISKVRPAGARLKTFGGRASGPEHLERLFKFTVNLFKHAAGRKLESIECHDLMCMIGEIVVVGGVRRSALLSLSNLSDLRMRDAKSGNWWDTHPHRKLANNSVSYTERPEIGHFMEEWLALYKSYSGERGIINREALRYGAKKYGKRDASQIVGVNPCCFTGDTLVAVADGRNAVTIKELADWSKGRKKFDVFSARPTNKSSRGWWKTEIKSAVAKKTGKKKVYEVTLSNGDTFRATDDHLLATASGNYVMVKDSLGVKLEKFFSFMDKYRHVNTYSDWSSRQYVKIWQHHNGDVPEGKHIDHIVSGATDNISNLQLLSEKKHMKKTSVERRGEDNPVHRIEDREAWEHNLSVVTSGENNPRWSGLTDSDLIIIGKKCVKRGLKLNAINCRSINSSFPLYFSKNRFGGSFANFRAIVAGEQAYEAPKFKVKIEKESKQSQYSYLSDSIEVTSIEYVGVEDIYDLNVEDNHNFYIITSGDENYENSEGILVHNSEIVLRSLQFCNLSTIVARPEDTKEMLMDKVRVAAIFGTMQSTLTTFKFLRKKWKHNTEEESLLGVSMTGILDHPLLGKISSEERDELLNEMRLEVEKVNEKYAELFEVNKSVATTAIKPEGTVSELVDSASGIHPRFSEYYIRSVRGDNKDPLTQFLKTTGIKWEPENGKESSTTVFYFPKKSPSTAVTRDGITALEQLELWKAYQIHYCEHKPSITVYVREGEWLEVSAWVWKNFDIVSGVSFLPYDNGVYQQAPYTACTKEEYEALLATTPSDIDWSKLEEFERDDEAVTATREYACTGGACELK